MKYSIILSLALLLLLSSCGVIGTEQFSKQKYTKFKRGKGSVHRTEQLMKTKSIEIEQVRTEVVSTEIDQKELSGTGIIPTMKSSEIPSSITENVNTPQLNKDQKPYSFRLHSKGQASADGGVYDVLLIILCIFIAPLAVLLIEGVTGRFWLTLLFYLIGGGGFFSPYVYIGLFMLIAIILAFMAYFNRN